MSAGGRCITFTSSGKYWDPLATDLWADVFIEDGQRIDLSVDSVMPVQVLEGAAFAFTIPFVEGTARIPITVSVSIWLGEGPVYASAPVVSLASPDGGEGLRGGALVQWTASVVDLKVIDTDGLRIGEDIFAAPFTVLGSTYLPMIVRK